MGCIKHNLTNQQLAAVVMLSFPKKEWRNAFAVAKAESGGGPSQIAPNPGSQDKGLFQINTKFNADSLKRLGPNWCDPLANAKEAAKIQKSRGWKDWCTWPGGCGGAGSGTAKQFFGSASKSFSGLTPDKAKEIVSKLGLKGGNVPSSGGGGDSAIPGLAEFQKLVQFFTCTGNWIRVGMGVLGAVLLFVAAAGLLLRLGVTSAGLDIIAGAFGKKGRAGLGLVKKATR